jgi:hypothetical protein
MASLDPTEATLLSGGAAGSEVAFSQQASRWGLQQETYSFAGRPVQHREGLILLDSDALSTGVVRAPALVQLQQRLFPSTGPLRNVLCTIWHQVATSQAVFLIGQIRNDGTVKGGTGWAAELAKNGGVPVGVFDQERNAWFEWAGTDWDESGPPRIEVPRFTGSGTRCLLPNGAKAIETLFERSFA